MSENKDLNRDKIKADVYRKTGVAPASNWKQKRFIRKMGAAAAALAVICLVTGTVLAASGEFRTRLAEILQIDTDKAQEMEISTTDSGIKMTLAGAYICDNIAAVYVRFERVDNKVFEEDIMGSGACLYDAQGRELSHLSNDMKLSEDLKLLEEYHFFYITEPGQFILKSDYFGYSCPALHDDGAYAVGNWEVSFTLEDSGDSAKTVEFSGKNQIEVEVYKESVVSPDVTLRLKKLTLTQQFMLISTETLGERALDEEEKMRSMLSSVTPGYEKQKIRIEFEDGTTQELDFCVLNDNTIWVPFFEDLPVDTVSAISVTSLEKIVLKEEASNR